MRKVFVLPGIRHVAFVLRKELDAAGMHVRAFRVPVEPGALGALVREMNRASQKG
jgi:hypothetical protein